MVQVSPQTITGGDNGSGYSYEHTTIEGFAMTQMSGVGWYGDLGNFLVMPTTGPMYTLAGQLDKDPKGWRADYDKKTETAQAGYYSVYLSKYGIKVETSALPHCGMMRMIYPQNKQSRLQIDLARRVGGTASQEYIRVLDNQTIQGWMECTPDGGGWGNGDGNARYKIYFYATLSKPMTDYGFWSADIPDGQKRKLEDVTSKSYLDLVANSRIIQHQTELQGRHIGFFSNFSTTEGEQVELKVGLSFVDLEGARNNYFTEIDSMNFDAVKRHAHKLWNEALATIEVEGGTLAEKRIFYTALYHTMIDPRIYQDVDGRYIGGDYKIHVAPNGFTKRTVFSGWDVFRSQFPLQTLINPNLVSDMIGSLTTMAEQSGRHYFERWELMNAYSGCMLGNPALSVLADAYIKGIRNYDVQKAYEYACNSSEKFGNGSLGYSPGEIGISQTLEYAYHDWCLSALAKAMGNKEGANTYYYKSMAYKNLFDKRTGWFRPKDAEGKWLPLPPEGRLKEWYGCMECNPLQQGWFVPHDVPGMVKLMGGRKRVLNDLKQLFENTPKNFMWNLYYNHANEPVHFVPYLFNRLGEPWNTQKWTRTICKDAYADKVEGLVGNEDVGQMSAWYVLAASGVSQYCPGETRYEITSPVFNKVTFHLNDGKVFTIIAPNNSIQNIYIRNARLNGKPYHKCYIDYADIKAGSVLELEMANQPNKHFK